LLEVKDLLGNHSLAMVMRYAHLAPEHLRSTMSRLDGVLKQQSAGSGANRAQERGQKQITTESAGLTFLGIQGGLVQPK
jgi:hypothetical protein